MNFCAECGRDLRSGPASQGCPACADTTAAPLGPDVYELAAKLLRSLAVGFSHKTTTSEVLAYHGHAPSSVTDQQPTYFSNDAFSVTATARWAVFELNREDMPCANLAYIFHKDSYSFFSGRPDALVEGLTMVFLNMPNELTSSGIVGAMGAPHTTEVGDDFAIEHCWLVNSDTRRGGEPTRISASCEPTNSDLISTLSISFPRPNPW